MGMGTSIMGSDFFAQSPLGFSALLLLKPQGLFISFARTKETKQRKFAVCTFLPTPALFSAKQKELADAQTAFCFSRSEKHLRFTAKKWGRTLLLFSQHCFARWMWVFSRSFTTLRFTLDDKKGNWLRYVIEILHYALLHSGWQRNEFTSEAMCPPWEGYSGLRGEAWRNFCIFSLRTKSCLSVSGFFLFRKNVKILASERQPALFLFVSFSFVRTKGKRKSLA